MGNLILSTTYEFYFDDVTVTSFINIIYGSVAAVLWPHKLWVSAAGQFVAVEAVGSDVDRSGFRSVTDQTTGDSTPAEFNYVDAAPTVE